MAKEKNGELIRYSMLHAGKALDDFINHTTMIETKIGDYGTSSGSDNSRMIISGHMIEKLGDPTWILTSIDTYLDQTSKFSSVFGKTPAQLLNNYYTAQEKDETEMSDTISKLKRLNTNKLIVLPFKPGMLCNLNIKMETVTVNKDATIKSIKWTTDKETYKLQCMINFEANTQYGGSKLFKLPITEYTKSFNLKNIGFKLSASGSDMDLISITEYGIFKPIEISDGSLKVAIDGSFLYVINNDDIFVIGYWNNDELIVKHKLNNSKAMKKLMKNLDNITTYRRYIGPYMLFPCVKIDTK